MYLRIDTFLKRIISDSYTSYFHTKLTIYRCIIIYIIALYLVCKVILKYMYNMYIFTNYTHFTITFFSMFIKDIAEPISI